MIHTVRVKSEKELLDSGWGYNEDKTYMDFENTNYVLFESLFKYKGRVVDIRKEDTSEEYVFLHPITGQEDTLIPKGCLDLSYWKTPQRLLAGEVVHRVFVDEPAAPHVLLSDRSAVSEWYSSQFKKGGLGGVDWAFTSEKDSLSRLNKKTCECGMGEESPAHSDWCPSYKIYEAKLKEKLLIKEYSSKSPSKIKQACGLIGWDVAMAALSNHFSDEDYCSQYLTDTKESRR